MVVIWTIVTFFVLCMLLQYSNVSFMKGSAFTLRLYTKNNIFGALQRAMSAALIGLHQNVKLRIQDS